MASVISGSHASPKPPAGGKPAEHDAEENETESRSSIQGQGVAVAALKGDKTFTE